MYCYNYGIPLLRVAYTDLEQLEDILEQFIKKYRYKIYNGNLMYSSGQIYKDFIQAIDLASISQ